MEAVLIGAVIILLCIILYQAVTHRRTSAQLEEINQTLHHHAARDELTGLWNRRALTDKLKEVLPQVCERPISLLMVDLDHFKKINDKYGHQVGDDVLEHTATLLRRSIRRTDFAARYGGEEFVLIIMDASGDYAESLAERIRKEIEENPDREHYTAKVTASVGVLDLRSVDDRSIRTVLEGVDKALYMAKESGRNTVFRGDEYLSTIPPAPRLPRL
jgi:diguanylate cyclase (GGDEF)-like protein